MYSHDSNFWFLLHSCCVSSDGSYDKFLNFITSIDDYDNWLMLDNLILTTWRFLDAHHTLVSHVETMSIHLICSLFSLWVLWCLNVLILELASVPFWNHIFGECMNMIRALRVTTFFATFSLITYPFIFFLR